jgi:hypothetical protein
MQRCARDQLARTTLVDMAKLTSPAPTPEDAGSPATELSFVGKEAPDTLPEGRCGDALAEVLIGARHVVVPFPICAAASAQEVKSLGLIEGREHRDGDGAGQ